MVIIIDPIIPRRIVQAKVNAYVYEEVQKAIERELTVIENLFAVGTRTWSSKSKPSWKKRITRGLSISGWITTGDTPFMYVEVGTRYRLRRMSSDFRPKTTPGVLGSRPGAGGPAGWFRGTGLKPGIVGRNFRGIIVEKRRVPFTFRINQAIVNGLRRSGL